MSEVCLVLVRRVVLLLLLAYGRFGVLYRIIFNLPYFSATRNPIKFMHPFFVCTAILAGYGAEAIWRLYMQNGTARTEGLIGYVLKWWSKVTGFEKKWTVGCLIAIGVWCSAYLVLVAKKDALEHYLAMNAVVPGTEPLLASFCIYETTCYIIFLTLSVIAVTFAISGAWRGKQAKWAWIFMGVILIFDLGRTDRYWLKYYNVREKYTLNPMLDFLHKEPYDKKSTAKLFPLAAMTSAVARRRRRLMIIIFTRSATSGCKTNSRILTSSRSTSCSLRERRRWT